MVKDGYWYGLPLVLIAGGLMGFWLHERSLFLLIVTIFFAVLSFLVLNFFRDPERPVPAEPRRHHFARRWLGRSACRGGV